MNCAYIGGGITNDTWVYDGKKLSWQGLEMGIPSTTDDGMGTKISVKKLGGRDRFELDMVAGFVPMVITVDFSERSSVMSSFGLKIHGTCF